MARPRNLEELRELVIACRSAGDIQTFRLADIILVLIDYVDELEGRIDILSARTSQMVKY